MQILFNIFTCTQWSLHLEKEAPKAVRPKCLYTKLNKNSHCGKVKGSLIAQLVKILLAMQETLVQFLG